MLAALLLYFNLSAGTGSDIPAVQKFEATTAAELIWAPHVVKVVTNVSATAVICAGFCLTLGQECNFFVTDKIQNSCYLGNSTGDPTDLYTSTNIHATDRSVFLKPGGNNYISQKFRLLHF